ncbi:MULTISPECIES: TetR family transcriptional regulator C-terminal domain-containing protein [Arthrobacter]|uniref:TetR family transcriptional regulator C-terminal domain-containing protein n=2 Tax=Arthrobacter TaxID=1663 RepID=A0ABU9KJY4_9MICC|nr:TetR family transcriptional regulator C-terminal domain-containing protein [Arthrobacter sp. YJM1]MDP5227123.1 TetR family transcriptional regulator C-terminal domain-containing protein [Arthrobacter sp. YJM1]
MPKVVNAAARRADVADAVFRIIVTDGLARVSLREVAAEAGLVVGSVRHYFSDSAELLRHAFATANERLEDRLQERLPALDAASDAGDTEELLESSVLLLSQFLPLDGDAAAECSARIEFRLASRGNPDLQTEAERGYRATAAVVGHLIQLLRPEGELDDLVVEAERLLSLLDGLSLHALVHSRWLDAATCRAVLVNHLRDLLPATH